MATYIDGTNAYTATASVSTDTASPPTLPSGVSSYYYSTAAAGTPGYHVWKSLPGDTAWQFRRLMYLGSAAGADVDMVVLRSGADAATMLTVRAQGTDKLRLAGSDGAFPWTSTPTIPHDGLYRCEGYGNSSSGLARIGLFPVTDTNVVSGFDSSEVTAVQGGGVGVGAVRLGKVSGSSAYSGKVAWALNEFYTGADATMAFLGPYGSTSVGDATPAAAYAGAVSLTANATGTPTGYTWSIQSVPSGTSPTIINPSSATAHFLYTVAGTYGLRVVVAYAGGNVTKDFNYTAPTPGGSFPQYEFFYDSGSDTWL